jgi:hypothetical protein
MENLSGNMYFNLIRKNSIVQDDFQILKGGPYGLGLGMEISLENQAKQIRNETKGSLIDSMKIIEVGLRTMHSSTFTKWVISNNPSLAYMKPWWIWFTSSKINK